MRLIWRLNESQIQQLLGPELVQAEDLLHHLKPAAIRCAPWNQGDWVIFKIWSSFYPPWPPKKWFQTKNTSTDGRCSPAAAQLWILGGALTLMRPCLCFHECCWGMRSSDITHQILNGCLRQINQNGWWCGWWLKLFQWFWICRCKEQRSSNMKGEKSKRTADSQMTHSHTDGRLQTSE